MDIKNYINLIRKGFKQLSENFRDIYLVLTVGIIAFHLFFNTLWIYLNNVPPAWDAAFHTVLSMRMVDFLQHHSVNFNFQEFITISKYYPPLVHFIGIPLVFLSGYSSKAVQMTGTFFFALLLLAQYLYVRDSFKSKKVAFFSVFFLSFFITFFKESRDHMTDIPLTAFFILGLYYLSKTKHFLDRKYTLIFFFTFSLAFLTKWTAVVFFSVPILIELFWIFRKHRFHPEIMYNFIMGGLLTAVICLPWYMANIETIISIARTSTTAELDDPQVLLSLENLLYYVKVSTIFQMTFVGFIFFVISCGILLREKVGRYFVTLLLTFITSYIVFTFFIANKNIRYIFPITPFFAVIMGFGLDQIVNSVKYKRLILFAPFVVMYVILSYFILSFGVPLKPEYKRAVQLPIISWVDIYYLHTDPVKILYDSDIWPNKVIAQLFLDERVEDTPLMYFISRESPYLNASTVHISLYELERRVPVGMQEVDTNFPLILNGGRVFGNDADIEAYIEKADIILIPKNYIGPKEGVRDLDVRIQIQKYFMADKAKNFAVYREIELPDGDTAFIYKKKSSGVPFFLPPSNEQYNKYQ